VPQILLLNRQIIQDCQVGFAEGRSMAVPFSPFLPSHLSWSQ
jgi:hypothetical protein